MDLLTLLLGLPFAPLRGVIAIADVLREQAERELYDPTAARRQMEELGERREAGEITAEQEAEEQQQILDRMIEQPGGEAPGGDTQQRHTDRED